MRLGRWSAVALVAALGAAGLFHRALAQESEPAPSEKDGALGPAGDEDEALEGFWPSRRMTENFIRRTTVQIAQQYALNEAQAKYLEDLSLKRWPKFLAQNRRKLQPLLNRYLERRMAVEPPNTEEVQAWAEGALVMLEAFRQEMHEQQMDFRRVLEPAQKLKFDAELIKFHFGMEAFEAKLTSWKQGRYEEREVWDRIRSPGQARPTRVAENAPASTQPAELADALLPVDEWARYVDRFAVRYGLDEAQMIKAKSILDELYGRAKAHLIRHQTEYEELDHRSTGQQDEQWRKARQDLDQPVVALFNELVVRLDGLLTGAQRKRVEQSSAPAGNPGT